MSAMITGGIGAAAGPLQEVNSQSFGEFWEINYLQNKKLHILPQNNQ